MAKIKLERLEQLALQHFNASKYTPPSFDFTFNSLDFTIILFSSNNENDAIEEKIKKLD